MKYPKPYRRLLKWAVLSVLLLALAEVLLRFFFGFGVVPVYYPSNSYEYALVPGQQLQRLGNEFSINAEGMRSAPLSGNEFRVLKFGDSVLNGGIRTDQKELCSSILEVKLADLNTEKKVRILNVSNGSWGPDNAFAWMEEHGRFDAVMIVLVFSSHDWQDQMSFIDVVGRVPFYPAEQPTTAISDFISWGWSRTFGSVAWDHLPSMVTHVPAKAEFNTGWAAFIEYCAQERVPLLVYHHAEAGEARSGTWNENGQKLEAYLLQNRVTVLSGIDSEFDNDDYRDEIHPTASGQRKIALALEPVIVNLLTREDEQ